MQIEEEKKRSHPFRAVHIVQGIRCNGTLSTTDRTLYKYTLIRPSTGLISILYYVHLYRYFWCVRHAIVGI